MDGADVSSTSRYRTRSATAKKFHDTMDKYHIGEQLTKAESKVIDKLAKMPSVLSKAQLKNLDEHKYSSGGATLLDPYFQPFWRWLVEQMPLWLAPNLITTIGLVVNVVTCSLLLVCSPNADGYVSGGTFGTHERNMQSTSAIFESPVGGGHHRDITKDINNGLPRILRSIILLDV